MALCLSLLLAGCGRPPAPKVTPNQPGSEKIDAAALAVKDLLQVHEADKIYDLLQAINSDQPLSDAERDFAVKEAFLTPNELIEIEANHFKQMDGHHLESCFLFRDVARHLEQSRLTGERLADFAMDWVDRTVLLDGPSGPSWWPPHILVYRGFGSGMDRAFVFLALARQLGFEGAYLSKTSPRVVLLIDQKPVVYDLEEIRKIGPLKLDEKAEPLQLDLPLQALAPRMKYLEERLREQSRVKLSVDGLSQSKVITEATGQKPQVWNTAVQPKTEPPKSPTRNLRFYLPPSEGGVDRKQRIQEFQQTRMPIGPILAQLQQMNLAGPVMNPLTNQLFIMYHRYGIEPRGLVVRGQYQAAMKRIERVKSVLEVLEFSSRDDATFRAEVAKWRDELNALYARAAQQGGDREAVERINKLWGQDQFFLALLSFDGEEQPRAARGILSDVAFTALREPLTQQGLFLAAIISQEKAEMFEAQSSKRSDDAWLDARSAWTRYLERHPTNPSNLKQRIEAIREPLPTLLHDWAMTCQARWGLMEAQMELGQQDQAEVVRKAFLADVQTMLDGSLDASLAKFLQKAGPSQEPWAKEFQKESSTLRVWKSRLER